MRYVEGKLRLTGYEMSACQRYNYWSGLTWDVTLPTLGWVLLRPTGNPTRRSMLLRFVQDMSTRLGFGSFSACYLFAYRAVSVSAQRLAADMVGPDNDSVMSRRLSGITVVMAWGDHGNARFRNADFLASDVYHSLDARYIRLDRMGCPTMGGVYERNSRIELLDFDEETSRLWETKFHPRRVKRGWSYMDGGSARG